MKFYIDKKRVTLDKLFKEISSEKLLTGMSKTTDSKYVITEEGTAVKLTLSIETIAWTKNKAQEKLFTAKRELEEIKKNAKDDKK